VPCAESLRVQAYFDGEVDAVAAADIERHMEHCSDCRALLQELELTRSALRRDLTYGRTPPELRARIMRALDQESAVPVTPTPTSARTPAPTPKLTLTRVRSATAWRTRPFWAGAVGGFGSAAIAASAAFLLLSPPAGNALLNDLVGAHVRSLMPAHLIDVESTDRHTVKPWFAGHADVSPVVADFTQEGYRLIGGRADYFDHQRAAVAVYQHGPHVINVFSWAGMQRGLPKNTTRNGYHLAFWKVGDLQYCAVSDTGWEELFGLAKLLQDLGARDSRP
jgi:anti-sigma factor RsiW